MVLYSRQLQLIGSFDVLVCGGGPAGIAAAITAAENGANVALLEQNSYLGGMATGGCVNPMSEFSYKGERVIGGFAWRFAHELMKVNGAILEEPRGNLSFNPETYKLVAQRLANQVGIHLFTNTFIADCLLDGDAIRHVVVANKNGLQAISGRYVIDTTGDADVAFHAGVPMLPNTRPAQPGTLIFSLANVDTTTPRMHIIHQKNNNIHHSAGFIRELFEKLRGEGVDVPQFGGPWFCSTVDDGCITVNMSRAPMDAVDATDYQHATAQLRENVFRFVSLLKQHVPEFKNCVISSIAPMTGVRQSRRIKGKHVLTGTEYLEATPFADAIARACHPIDIHLPSGDGQILHYPKVAAYIPFRSLQPEGVSNLLVAGRPISADEDAFAGVRVQATCMETGEAAGLAAALCVQQGGIPLDSLDLTAVTSKIRAGGTILPLED
ncbi:MAG: FAD-dependent oxidoreductase [Victivallales bacterium]|nr:FAD-dependent oxidoreductase [Victivallales bacterium]